MTSLKLENVSVKIENTPIVSGANINVSPGSFVGLIGLNGAGKSTLLKAVYGVNKYVGHIELDGKDIQSYSSKELAKSIAVLIQENSSDFDFKVRDIVLLGRLPYKGFFEGDTEEDLRIVEKSLANVGMTAYANRYFNSLSGGEKQRVLIARILAQQSQLLILDEPTNHLDVKNQFSLFEMIKGLKITVFAVLHDLNLATKFCDYIYLVYDGKIYAEGRPCDLFTEKLLAEVFQMKAKIYRDGDDIHIEYIASI